jgi:hypothetical protein
VRGADIDPPFFVVKKSVTSTVTSSHGIFLVKQEGVLTDTRTRGPSFYT